MYCAVSAITPHGAVINEYRAMVELRFIQERDSDKNLLHY